MISFKEARDLKEYDAVSLSAMVRVFFIDHFPARDVQRIEDAIQVASYLHRDDVRRGARGTSHNPPYIEHPLRVAIRLFKYFGVEDADVIIAAVLHDTVEDHPFEFSHFQGVTATIEIRLARDRALEFIAQHFGYEVASIVEKVSNPIMPGEPSKAEKVSAYQQHVEMVVNYSEKALIVKFSDFVDNAGSLHHHYAPGDSKVAYFLDRYEPLISIYRDALDRYGLSKLFNATAAHVRLTAVEDQFEKFRAGQFVKVDIQPPF